MKSINPTRMKDIIENIHVDYKEDIDTFSSEYPNEILGYCEAITKCHQKLCLFNQIPTPSQKASHTFGFVYMAIDNIYTSMKLLIIGYIVPSGNMYRQSIEAVCMSILLSSPEKIKINGKNERQRKVNFFDSY